MKETFNKIIKMFTSDVTFISSRSSTERTLDCRSSWAQCRNSIKASAPSFKEPPLHSTPFFMSGWHHYNNHTLEPFHELNLDSQRVNKLASKLHILSVDYAAKLVYNRRAHSSTVINSHQERLPGQACNPPHPHSFPCSLVEEFYATVRCRLLHYTKLPWREIKTTNGLQALTKAKQREEASAKSISQRAQMGTPTSQSTSWRGGGGKNNPS